MRSCIISPRALAAAFLLLVSVSDHVGATSSASTTTIYSTTTVATTTTTVTLLSNSQYSFVPTTQEVVSTEAVTSVVPVSEISSMASSGTTTMTASASSSSAAASGSPFQAEVLNSTNYYRAQYQADPVVWNDTLADYATKWAKGCIWKHSGGPYGENLAANFSNSTLAIDAWGNEEDTYNWAKQKFSEATGHFTQLVWQNTTDVGCGLVQCSNGNAHDSEGDSGIDGAFLVCEYSPQGNVKGEYGYNVQKPGESDDGEIGFGSGAMRIAGGGMSKAAVLVAALVVGVSIAGGC